MTRSAGIQSQGRRVDHEPPTISARIGRHQSNRPLPLHNQSLAWQEAAEAAELDCLVSMRSPIGVVEQLCHFHAELRRIGAQQQLRIDTL